MPKTTKRFPYTADEICDTDVQNFYTWPQEEQYAGLKVVCAEWARASGPSGSVQEQTAYTQLILQYAMMAAGVWWTGVKVWQVVRPIWRTFRGHPQGNDIELMADYATRGDHGVEKTTMARTLASKAQKSKDKNIKAAAEQLLVVLRDRSSSPEAGSSGAKRSSSSSPEAKGKGKGKGKGKEKERWN